MDNIRVLRVIEYTGPRDLVEKCIERSIHGARIVPGSGGRSYKIHAATLGVVSEILGDDPGTPLFGEESNLS